MAKKKKTTHHRRRKVGASGDAAEFALKVVGVVGGAVIGAYGVQAINTAIGSSLPSWGAPSMVGAGGAVLCLPAIAKKAPFAADFGLGLLGAGALLGLNQAGLNIPGISGMAMTSNAPAGSQVLQKSVGCANRKGIGNGPAHYLNRTVGKRVTRMSRNRNAMAVGSLYMD